MDISHVNYPSMYYFDENFKYELDTLVRKKKRTIFKAVENWEGEGKLKVVWAHCKLMDFLDQIHRSHV
jgi:hypothetical protein